MTTLISLIAAMVILAGVVIAANLVELDPQIGILCAILYIVVHRYFDRP
jgi:hypothetical protein